MITIAISDFRAHIQEYLGYISRGEEIIITSRGKEIAMVIPPENKIISARKKLEELAKTAVLKNVTDPISAEWKSST